ARRHAALVRQAVRSRLLRVPRVGQDCSGPRAATGRRHWHPRALRRSVRAAHGHRARRLPGRPERGARVKATVLVRPKPGILDPQGEAVGSALGHLGFEVSDTRVGKVIDLEVEAADATAAKALVEKMCERLLANPLIESYEVEIVG